MAYDGPFAHPVITGGTGRATLTNHSVLIGAATAAISQVGPVASTGCVLQSNGVGSDPGFSTATYPSTTTINQVLYSSSNNVIGGITAANNGTLISGATGIPSWLANGNTGEILTATAGSPPSWQANAAAGAITTINGDSGSITGNTVTIYANNAAKTSGATVKFVNSGTTSTLQVSDAANYTTIIGSNSGNLTLTGIENTIVGSTSGVAITTGAKNVVLGDNAFSNCTTASDNVVIGSTCMNLAPSFTGSFNIVIGTAAGSTMASTESNNIYIGTVGSVGESNAIRIGTPGLAVGDQTTCFIAGIRGVAVANTQMVTINTSTNQLGSQAIPTTISWSVITADQTAVVAHGYICNKGSALLLTLPATAAVGDTIRVTGINTALGWKIVQNANQQIFFGNASTTLGATGFLQSAATRDSVEIVCVVAGASTVYNVISSVGNITVS